MVVFCSQRLEELLL